MTTPKPQLAPTNAQRQQALRERRAALGIKQLVIFTHQDDAPAIKALAEKLQSRREKTSR